ncbi:hypothetical protein [Anaeromyxobacter oryzae]|uniref:Alpha/beta hydrolase n=1 Tax=Anaeromyxobacter oryzae TaxID=2918170 RepID=A0ABM7WWC0_9BACT|nr:hypothetical protein [Anaeromyxobacter oryzae]BDG03804.1 hypothetical protein AMOR_28000 [Anaeromyxobacter oryzae]
MIAAGPRAIGAAALLVAVACVAGHRRLASSRLEAPSGPEVPPPPPAAEEPAPPPPLVPPPEPDRTQAPWSQTPFTPVPEGAVEETRDAGGRHLRLGTARGTIHVWLPPGYARRTAGIVLYVHGYYTNVDQAFVDHDLASQFRASGLDAAFIAPEAPDWNGAPVYWNDLAELLGEVAARAKLRLPEGPVVVSGHSGAIRTVLPWLSDPRVEEIVLLDGLYRGEDELSAWLAQAPAGRRRLLLVGQETAPLTEAWLPSLGAGNVVSHPRIPARLGARERRAPVVYLRSQYDHMALVTGGRVLPLLLRATRVRPLG